MTNIPIEVSREFIPGLPLVSRGKVRDTYALAGDKLLLPVATDRISIFDIVLNAEVPQKGEVLTALNLYWYMELSKASSMRHDIVAFGKRMNEYLPEEFRDRAYLQKRAIVVRKLNMIDVEAVGRGNITGSGWKAYMKTAPNHIVCGQSLPPGLKDGDRLSAPIFTPTTKESQGHDMHIDYKEVRTKYGQTIENATLELFALASEIALARGIVIADSKLEYGIDPETGRLTCGDERFTPDSSRFWLLDDWKRSRTEGRSPVSFDKQVVRNWGETAGIDLLDPAIPDDVKKAHDITVPFEVLMQTAQIYRYIFYLITQKRLEVFQREEMGIPTALPPVEVVLGSESDLPQAERGLEVLRRSGVRFRVHVVSCHRNPDALRQYAASMVPMNATIIAGAGKAAALPGVLQSWLRFYEKGHTPVVGVALQGKTDRETTAARLSIEELPGNPVVLMKYGQVYTGIGGFAAACEDACTKEFFIPTAASKEPKFNFIEG